MSLNFFHLFRSTEEASWNIKNHHHVICIIKSEDAISFLVSSTIIVLISIVKNCVDKMMPFITLHTDKSSNIQHAHRKLSKILKLFSIFFRIKNICVSSSSSSLTLYITFQRNFTKQLLSFATRLFECLRHFGECLRFLCKQHSVMNCRKNLKCRLTHNL